MNSVTQAKQLWKKQKDKFSVVKRTRSAVLGDGRGNTTANVEVPGSPDHVWVRDTAEATIFYPVLDKTGLPHTPDMPVILGYTDEESDIEQVLGIFAGGLGPTSITTVPTTLAHRQQHEFGGWDVPDIEGRLLTPGRISPTSPPSMTVNIGEFVYYYDGWKKYNGAVSESLTQFLPTTGFKGYVLLAFDPSIDSVVYRPSVYAIGTDQDIFPTFDSIPGPSGDEYPLGWVYLEATTTSVDWTTDSDNIGDARLHIGFPARNILDRLAQLEGLSGNDPNIALTGAGLNASDGYIHTLGNLLDVAVTGVTDGKALVYDQATNRWVPGNATGGGAALYTLGASDVAGTSAIGISASAAPGDHVHRGVQSVNVPGNGNLYGNVYILSGTGTTVTQSGNSVLISASGGAGAGWASAIQTPSRAFDVVYTNGSLTRMLAISVGMKPGVAATADISLRADAASPPTTEVVRLSGGSGLGASVTDEAVALIMPNEKYWLRNLTAAGGTAEITRWIEYDDSGGGTGGGAALTSVFNGRLTLDGSVAAPVTDVVGSSVVYYVPYNGDQIGLYTTGSAWSAIQFTAPSLILSGLSPNSAYDVFGFLNLNELTIETARWNITNVTRLTGVSAQNGIQVSSTNKTRVLLGTIYMAETSGITTDSAACRFVSNYYNRIPRIVGASEPTLSWAYSTNAWRSLNNNPANRIRAVFTNRDTIDLSGYGYARTNNAAILGQIGLGEDTTTANCAIPGVIGAGGSGNGPQAQLYARLIKFAPLGFHFYQAVEKSSGTSTSYFSADPAKAYESGVTGIIQG